MHLLLLLIVKHVQEVTMGPKKVIDNSKVKRKGVRTMLELKKELQNLIEVLICLI